MTKTLTERSEQLFKLMADDAGNWSGMPLLGGNFDFTTEDRGNLTDLKKAGLVKTVHDEGSDWVMFTEAGYEKACAVSEDYAANFAGEFKNSANLARSESK